MCLFFVFSPSSPNWFVGPLICGFIFSGTWDALNQYLNEWLHQGVMWVVKLSPVESSLKIRRRNEKKDIGRSIQTWGLGGGVSVCVCVLSTFFCVGCIRTMKWENTRLRKTDDHSSVQHSGRPYLFSRFVIPKRLPPRVKESYRNSPA